MATNTNNTDNKETIGSTSTTPGDVPSSSSRMSPGVTSSLHNNSATTFGTSPGGQGFGSSAFQSPSMSGHSGGGAEGIGLSTSPGRITPGGGGGGIIGGSARGDRRSRLVRDRSRSSATFASPGLVRMASVRNNNNNNNNNMMI